MRKGSYFLTLDERLEIIKLYREGAAINCISKETGRGWITVKKAVIEHYHDAFNAVYPDKVWKETYPRRLTKKAKRELAQWLFSHPAAVAERVGGNNIADKTPAPKTTKPELVVITGQPPAIKTVKDIARPKPRFVRFAEWVTGYSA